MKLTLSVMLFSSCNFSFNFAGRYWDFIHVIFYVDVIVDNVVIFGISFVAKFRSHLLNLLTSIKSFVAAYREKALK